MARKADCGTGARRPDAVSPAGHRHAGATKAGAWRRIRMWLINLAMRRPFTILVAVLSIALGSILALKRMPVDIFPDLNLPVIYVAQPYGGMDPAQMEGYLVFYYEYHFLYISWIEHVESKSI